jgi:hypothetical protein
VDDDDLGQRRTSGRDGCNGPVDADVCLGSFLDRGHGLDGHGGARSARSTRNGGDRGHAWSGRGILSWSPWWQYFLSFMVLSGLCLFVSKVITDDQLAGRPDDKMQRVCLGLAATTLFIVVMAVGAIGFARLAGYKPHETGAWAADHVFVFGGMAIAVVAGFLLKMASTAAPDAVAADGA